MLSKIVDTKSPIGNNLSYWGFCVYHWVCFHYSEIAKPQIYDIYPIGDIISQAIMDNVPRYKKNLLHA